MKFMIMILVIFSMSNVFAGKDFSEQTFENPIREISIIATEDGFYPNKIMAFQGEKIHFYVTSTTKEAQCFILQKHEVFLAADKGKVHQTSVLAEQPGRFKFYCPSNKAFGYLTVFEKNTAQEETSRSPASLKPSYWLPKDHD